MIKRHSMIQWCVAVTWFCQPIDSYRLDDYLLCMELKKILINTLMEKQKRLYSSCHTLLVQQDNLLWDFRHIYGMAFDWLLLFFFSSSMRMNPVRWIIVWAHANLIFFMIFFVWNVSLFCSTIMMKNLYTRIFHSWLRKKHFFII